MTKTKRTKKPLTHLQKRYLFLVNHVLYYKGKSKKKRQKNKKYVEFVINCLLATHNPKDVLNRLYFDNTKAIFKGKYIDRLGNVVYGMRRGNVYFEHNYVKHMRAVAERRITKIIKIACAIQRQSKILSSGQRCFNKLYDNDYIKYARLAKQFYHSNNFMFYSLHNHLNKDERLTMVINYLHSKGYKPQYVYVYNFLYPLKDATIAKNGSIDKTSHKYSYNELTQFENTLFRYIKTLSNTTPLLGDIENPYHYKKHIYSHPHIHGLVMTTSKYEVKLINTKAKHIFKHITGYKLKHDYKPITLLNKFIVNPVFKQQSRDNKGELQSLINYIDYLIKDKKIQTKDTDKCFFKGLFSKLRLTQLHLSFNCQLNNTHNRRSFFTVSNNKIHKAKRTLKVLNFMITVKAIGMINACRGSSYYKEMLKPQLLFKNMPRMIRKRILRKLQQFKVLKNFGIGNTKGIKALFRKVEEKATENSEIKAELTLVQRTFKDFKVKNAQIQYDLKVHAYSVANFNLNYQKLVQYKQHQPLGSDINVNSLNVEKLNLWLQKPT